MEPIANIRRPKRRTSMYSRIIPIFFLILTACTPLLIPTPDPTQMSPGMPTPVSSPTLQESIRLKTVELAIMDLSIRISMKPESVTMISVESMLWPDSSLGCPQPNETYAQVQTEGYLVRLEAIDKIYEYHTNTDNWVVLCKETELPSFPVTPGEVDDGKPWMPVN